MSMNYAKAGVNIKKEENAISGLAKILKKTFSFRKGRVGEVAEDIGTFANVVEMGDFLLALTTDGVGSKVLVCEELKKYDTIGIDLVGMLVNDLICLGAEPTTMVDYLALETIDAEMVRDIALGIHEGARQAKIAVVGGETASLPDVIKGVDKKGFDIAGAAVGVVKKEDLITGAAVVPGDVVLGLKSSGVHSNGLSLARKVLPKDMWLEILTPTKIYVEPVMKFIKEAVVHGLVNITGSGFRNLQRITKYGFVIDNLPEPQQIFKKIAELGEVDEKEMLQTFNMGIGFCVICDEENAKKLMEKYEKEYEIVKIGAVVKTPGVTIVKGGTNIKLD